MKLLQSKQAEAKGHVHTDKCSDCSMQSSDSDSSSSSSSLSSSESEKGTTVLNKNELKLDDIVMI
jgi:hypothetical protein